MIIYWNIYRKSISETTIFSTKLIIYSLNYYKNVRVYLLYIFCKTSKIIKLIAIES